MRLSLHVECPSPEVSVNHILSYDVAIYKLSIPTYIHLLVVVVVLEWGGGGMGTAREAYSYYGDKIGFGPCSNKLSICVKGWRSGDSARLPPTWPGFKSRCGLSLLLVLSLALSGFSLGTPVLPSPQKPTFANSNSTRNQVSEEPLYGCTTCKSLFIYLFIFILFILCVSTGSVQSILPSLSRDLQLDPN